HSFFDLGTLGEMGLIPGWPGAAVYPPQPMVSQTRDILEQYQANSGEYREVVITDTAHTPYVEKPQEFMETFLTML
ncbi:MAG: alpha/beta hydrolase, partial [Chloroflexota bacterium]|nr:alpha/beta hydrolase [Chloroflexota bacterium]